ncbi:MACPF domain-containing protein CAD1 isoform X1 [Dioscorea cayenensis subsp. rotundata]|uniref:MACPF domain-containing protein CAD1 isoform X1 n=1 Tax=Dioscorea cayennensis subsp. rotundata TaxID=55577 RepID=A0AB40ANU4_DIOCR|nr:MACPF domain-containing protein CAD1 isoform X1 [Dioscorea cayenensis subsp. rotundata]
MDRRMGSEDALIATLSGAIQTLGRGFDVTSDARLLYCKGAHGSLVVRPDEGCARDFGLSESGPFLRAVPVDVDVSRGRGGRRETTQVCSFHEMAQYFNRKSGLSEKEPLGSFNSMFNFTGSWKTDAAMTKALAMDSYFIPLFKVELNNPNLALREEVKRAGPRSWDPQSLASFIEKFGTHIITSVTIGGRDEVYIKQHISSPLSSADIEKYVQDIGDRRFLTLKSHFTSSPIATKAKSAGASPQRDMNSQPFSVPYLSGKEDVMVIFRRRGGDDLVENHMEWASTVSASPDVINMTFLPIVSLLEGMPGIKHLARAVDLYLEYKPPIEELQYFLEFQIQQLWAPIHDNIAGHQRKEPVCPSLQFSLMSPKLYISSEQISVGRRPVTGLKLCLEGSKQNRLAIQLKHLGSLPKILKPHWDSHIAIGPPKWQGPEEQDSRWFEPIKWKNFAHVSTAPIEHTEVSFGDLVGVYIVTGAQLGVWDFGAKSVLHLKLLFSKIPGCTIRRSVWDHSPSCANQPLRSDEAASSSNDSSTHIGKLLKIVDSTEMSRGPEDIPGHWLVTGAKLGVEKGKIVIRAKYSILNY